jgi:hypothetical protein
MRDSMLFEYCDELIFRNCTFDRKLIARLNVPLMQKINVKRLSLSKLS